MALDENLVPGDTGTVDDTVLNEDTDDSILEDKVLDLRLMQELKKKKQKAYAEAQKYREEKEALEQELEKLKMSEDSKYKEELAAIQSELDKQREALQSYERALSEKAAEKARMELSYAAELTKVKEQNLDFVEFLLKKDLDAAEGDALKSFSIRNWMGDLKEKRPELFDGTTAQKPLANSGIIPGDGGNVTTTNTQPRLSQTYKELKERDSDWESFRKTNAI